MSAKVDWSYLRPGCKTCAKTQDFFTKAGIKIVQEVNAKKTVLQQKEALELARKVDHLYVAKGKSMVHVDLRKEHPDEAALKKLLLGPTGKLRAPTLRFGKMLVLGFNRDMYEQLLG
jgi:arsenate reductase-like glutaredoxin family protein